MVSAHAASTACQHAAVKPLGLAGAGVMSALAGSTFKQACAEQVLCGWSTGMCGPRWPMACSVQVASHWEQHAKHVPRHGGIHAAGLCLVLAASGTRPAAGGCRARQMAGAARLLKGGHCACMLRTWASSMRHQCIINIISSS